jgi:molybdenum cofactor synthesis domain-containing protein
LEAVIGILTVSDSRSAGENPDLSGPAVAEALSALGFQNVRYRIVPDELPEIQSAIRELASECAAVFTTGGSGFSPRDITPEATAPLLDRRADNLCELMRLRGLERTPMSHLSRGIAGVMGAALIVNLPGSPKGAAEGIQAIGALLTPILLSLSGEGCPH